MKRIFLHIFEAGAIKRKKTYIIRLLLVWGGLVAGGGVRGGVGGAHGNQSGEEAQLKKRNDHQNDIHFNEK